MEADPPVDAGKAGTAGEASEAGTQSLHRGIGDGMYAHGRPTQHGKPHRVVGKRARPTDVSRETDRARWGGGEGRSTAEAG